MIKRISMIDPNDNIVWEKKRHNLNLIKTLMNIIVCIHMYTCMYMHTIVYIYLGKTCMKTLQFQHIRFAWRTDSFHYLERILFLCYENLHPLPPPLWSYMGLIYVTWLVGVFKTLCRGISPLSKVTKARWYFKWKMKLERKYLSHAFY